MNYFITRLALTYVNFLEVQNFFNISSDKSTLIVLYQDIESPDHQQIKKMLNPSLWSKIFFLPYNVDALNSCKKKVKRSYGSIHGKVHEIIDIYRFVNKLNTSINPEEKTEKVFIGDHHIASMRHLVHRLHAEEVILVDEGARVYEIFEKRRKEITKRNLGILKSDYWKHTASRLFFGYHMQSLKDYSFFSSWEFPDIAGIRVYKNEYAFLRKNMGNLATTSDVLLLGQPFIDRKRMIPEVYLGYLEKIQEWFKGRKILYKPHRGESADVIEYIRRNTGFAIADMFLPVEYYLTMSGPVPFAVGGFISTALQNCQILLDKKAQVVSFRVDIDDIIWNKKMVSSLYDYYATVQSDTFSVVNLY
jgi:hypothetical protein